MLYEQRLEFLTEFEGDRQLDSKAIPKPTHKPKTRSTAKLVRGFVYKMQFNKSLIPNVKSLFEL